MEQFSRDKNDGADVLAKLGFSKVVMMKIVVTGPAWMASLLENVKEGVK